MPLYSHDSPHDKVHSNVMYGRANEKRRIYFSCVRENKCGIKCACLWLEMLFFFFNICLRSDKNEYLTIGNIPILLLLKDFDDYVFLLDGYRCESIPSTTNTTTTRKNLLNFYDEFIGALTGF